MNFVLQEPHGNQEEYIQYLKTLVHDLVKHHLHCHEECQFVSSAGLANSPTAPVTTHPDVLSSPRDTLSRSKRQKRGLETQNEQTKDLQMVFWNPEDRPKPRDTGTRPWLSLAKKLVDVTPLAAGWWATAEMLELDTIMQGGQAARFVLDGTVKTLSIPRREESAVSYQGGSEVCYLLAAARSYAKTAAGRALTVQCTLMLVNFQRFIVLCICAVLSHTGASKPALVGITRICFGNISEAYALRLWRTAVFLNQLVDGLGVRGWANRASELLLIWNHPPSYYEHLASAPNAALDYLTQKLSTKLHTHGVDERSGWTSLFIPSLIYNVLGQRIE
ncbi:hypothetical protein MMC13_005422 [Lambiella insularis]|nr:hypothetical protein [Lambiella insularis]